MLSAIKTFLLSAVRVALLTFLGTLLCFAVTLLLAILGALIVAAVRGGHPDMRIVYRNIALPAALVGGVVVLIVSAIGEIRHHRQNRALQAIERVS